MEKTVDLLIDMIAVTFLSMVREGGGAGILTLPH